MSSVDILITSCDSEQKPEQTLPSAAGELLQEGIPREEVQTNSQEEPEAAVAKAKVEATSSCPLEKSRQTRYSPSAALCSSPSSRRKSMSGIAYNFMSGGEENNLAKHFPSAPNVAEESDSACRAGWGGHLEDKALPSFGCLPMLSVASPPERRAETQQEHEGETSRQTAEEQEATAPESKQSSRAAKESEDSRHFLVVQDRMYPALRSKSLNANPRKTKGKSQEKPLAASSVKDLVAAFGSPGDKQTTAPQRNYRH